VASQLSYPFRFAANGSAAVVEQDSDEANAELIAVLALTRVGERGDEPGFGITDPAFGGFVPGELAAKIALYGPPVELDAVEVTPIDDSTQRVSVTFDDPGA
jgi:hypothetical protein